MKIFTTTITAVFGETNEVHNFLTQEEANAFVVKWDGGRSGEKNASDILSWYSNNSKEVDYTIALFETETQMPQLQNTFELYSEEFAKTIAGTVYERLFLLSLKNISKTEQKPSPAVNARDLFSQIENLAIEQGIVESKGKMFLGFFKSGGAGQKDVLLHLNGVDSGNNGCYYIDTEEFEDNDNESGLKDMVDKAGKFGVSRIEIY
ncbi:MAG: hypothetical protein PHE67_05285 [Campylobacterales bacterium]|nr:hypothetical protein [Campylobacterales bacterium]